MKITIDAAGRVVILKTIREAANIQPGAELEVAFNGGSIELRPVTRVIRLEKRGALLVAVAAGKSAKLKQSVVNETIDAVRSQKVPRSQ